MSDEGGFRSFPLHFLLMIIFALRIVPRAFVYFLSDGKDIFC